MENTMLWIAILVAVALGAFSLGTRATVGRGRNTEVDHHWWFGWWVRCKDDKCTLQWRKKGTNENWADTGVVPGGSVKYNERMEYRCNCPGEADAAPIES